MKREGTPTCWRSASRAPAVLAAEGPNWVPSWDADTDAGPATRRAASVCGTDAKEGPAWAPAPVAFPVSVKG
jgi:hypothetical protein